MTHGTAGCEYEKREKKKAREDVGGEFSPDVPCGSMATSGLEEGESRAQSWDGILETLFPAVKEEDRGR